MIGSSSSPCKDSITNSCLMVGDETENLINDAGLEYCVLKENNKYSCLNTNN